MVIFLSWACGATWAHAGTPGDHLHYFPDFSASSEAIFKIPDATCRKIDALSTFGALIDQTFAANGRNIHSAMRKSWFSKILENPWKFMIWTHFGYPGCSPPSLTCWGRAGGSCGLGEPLQRRLMFNGMSMPAPVLPETHRTTGRAPIDQLTMNCGKSMDL